MASSAALRRINSARDKSKPIPELGGPALRKSTTCHLVVCGVINPQRDNWLFGDFLGFVDALKQANPPVHGDFINCFPLSRYFDETRESDIKFGRRKEIGDADWDSGDEVVKYTRWQHDHRESWWTQVKQPSWTVAKSNILEWINAKADTAKPGAIVTIILIGHGNKNGIYIAGVPLSAPELAAACSNFAADIQVNIVIKACSSGAFAKAFRVSGQRDIYVHTSSKDEEGSFSDRRSISGRVRNSLFGASFVETLGLMRDEEEPWTLDKQKIKLEADLSGPLIPKKKRSQPQVVSDSPEKRLMWDIMYRDYIDLSFDCAPTNARRILTPPNQALTISDQPRIASALARTAPNVSSYTAAEALLMQEMEGVETDYPEPCDIGILDQLFRIRRRSGAEKRDVIEAVVKELSYRYRVQEQIFIVAESLMYLGLLSHQSLYYPMAIPRLTGSISAVVEGLTFFKYVEDARDNRFDAPVIWLATVIVRSCRDWTRILDRLVTIQGLGGLSDDAETACKGLRFTINAREGEETDMPPVYGFWLPHGVPMRDFVKTFLPRYSAVKKIYEGIMGEGAWGDNPMLEAAVTRILAAESELPGGGYNS